VPANINTCFLRLHMRIEDKKRLSPLPSSAHFNQNGPFEVKILDTTSKSSTDTSSDKKKQSFSDSSMRMQRNGPDTSVTSCAIATLRQQRSVSGQGIRHLLRSKCLCGATTTPRAFDTSTQNRQPLLMLPMLQSFYWPFLISYIAGSLNRCVCGCHC